MISSTLSEHQVEGSSFGAISYLRAEQDFDFQVSAFSKYGTLHFHPDGFGDIFFNGIAQDALRQSLANGAQADGSYNLGADHTLRAGLYLQGERASADTNSSVLPITACTGAEAAGDSRLPGDGRPHLWRDARVDRAGPGQDRLALQRLSPGRMESGTEAHGQLRRALRRGERIHHGRAAEPAPQHGVEADRRDHRPCRLCQLPDAAAVRAGGDAIARRHARHERELRLARSRPLQHRHLPQLAGQVRALARVRRRRRAGGPARPQDRHRRVL